MRAQNALMLAATPQQLRSQTPSRSPSPASPYEARHLLAAGNVSDRMDSAGEQCLLLRGLQASRWTEGGLVSMFRLAVAQSNFSSLAHVE